MIQLIPILKIVSICAAILAAGLVLWALILAFLHPIKQLQAVAAQPDEEKKAKQRVLLRELSPEIAEQFKKVYLAPPTLPKTGWVGTGEEDVL